MDETDQDFKIYRVLAEAYLRKKFTAEHIANSARISVEEVQTILNSRSDIFDQASEENFAYHLVSDTRDLLREELASISSETIPNEKRQKDPHIIRSDRFIDIRTSLDKAKRILKRILDEDKEAGAIVDRNDSDRIAEVNQAWEHLTQAREKIEHMQNADQLNPQTIALLGSKLRKSNERYRDATADMDTSKLSSGAAASITEPANTYVEEVARRDSHVKGAA